MPANPFTKATYVTNAHRLDQLPADTGLEVAFAGRSNAGKSSAINALTRQKSLARTSKTPGRTQQIVIFQLDENHRLADLPGYGYAKVPEKLRNHWKKVMQDYFNQRSSLAGVVLMMDIRHPLKPFDVQMLEWCSAFNVPCHVLLTKADKIKRGPGGSTLLMVERHLPDNATIQLFSAKTRNGVDELVGKLCRWLEIDHSKGENSSHEKT
jgi:GTP-binding protein